MSTILDLLEWTKKNPANREARDRRFSLLLDAHQRYLNGLTIIKITGTNGKGSVCAMLEASLQRAGKRTGMFTSPFLTRINERFRVAGEDISDDDLETHARAVQQFLTKHVAQHGQNSKPSFFEILILIALRYFHAENVEYAIVEAGIGGRYDATSLIPSQFAAITSVGLDHTEQLGPTLHDIATDKAGIAASGTHLVLGPNLPVEARSAILADIVQRQINLHFARGKNMKAHTLGLQGMDIEWEIGGETLRFSLPLPGAFQLSNLVTVYAILNVMTLHGKLDGTACLQGVTDTRWPGRLEYFPGDPAWLVDVAHNEDALVALKATLDEILPPDSRVLLYGAAADKAYRAVIPHVRTLADEIWLTGGFYRAENAHILAERFPDHPNLNSRENWRDAMHHMREKFSGSGKIILVLGSVYLAGVVRGELETWLTQ